MSTTPFSHLALVPADPILGITDAYRRDTRPQKVNLGVGIYQDGDGKSPVLASVREAQSSVLEAEKTKAYVGIDGSSSFTEAIARRIFGERRYETVSQRLVLLQSLGGSGALRLAAELIATAKPGSRVWVSNPTWENHLAILSAVGLEVREYPYFDPTTRLLNRDKMLTTLGQQLDFGDFVLLHACCHNPTGVDLEAEDWSAVVDLCSQRGAIPFIDSAYQGFRASFEADAAPLAMVADSGLPLLFSYSCSKNFGLYRERVGVFGYLATSTNEAAVVRSQAKRLVRTNYSSPPSFGAEVVSHILNTPALAALWEQEVGTMRERIIRMRQALVSLLRDHGVDFGFVLAQHGMFSYTGLKASAVDALRDNFAIYLVRTGRLCVAALNDANVKYVADSLAVELTK